MEMIRSLTSGDINSWLSLAKEVEHLFGKMVGVEEFENGIASAIDQNCAFGYEDSEFGITGIVAISKENNSIEWLAVSESSKGKGIGSMLIERAIEKLEQKKDIFVQTFLPEIPEGRAARKLYRKFGFSDYQSGGLNPAGINTVIMRRIGS
jgi:GNAT superfamily N-acetyltransferase